MRVKDILENRNGELLSVRPETELREAAVLMSENAIGALVVRSADGLLAGILTERDIARHFARNGGASETTVASVMTIDVITCSAEHDVGEIAEIMSESNIRHVPIVKKGAPVDIVSIRDIVRFHISALQSENRTLRELVAALD
jgi:CBS domain-containing protein